MGLANRLQHPDNLQKTVPMKKLEGLFWRSRYGLKQRLLDGSWETLKEPIIYNIKGYAVYNLFFRKMTC